ncbi:MAG: NADPH-dependent FMN reductase, partial [Sphingobacteriales bacterium]
MLTIISGTNRKDSMTMKVARLYHEIASGQTNDLKLLSLEGINVWERGPELKKLEEDMLIPSTRFIIIMPEYNGSFPGILKLLFDNSDIKRCWWYKKAALVG